MRDKIVVDNISKFVIRSYSYSGAFGLF